MFYRKKYKEQVKAYKDFCDVTHSLILKLRRQLDVCMKARETVAELCNRLKKSNKDKDKTIINLKKSIKDHIRSKND